MVSVVGLTLQNRQTNFSLRSFNRICCPFLILSEIQRDHILFTLYSYDCLSAVRQVREAALDAHFLVVATDLGKEKATQMIASNDFDPSIFAEHLVSGFTVCGGAHNLLICAKESHSLTLFK